MNTVLRLCVVFILIVIISLLFCQQTLLSRRLLRNSKSQSFEVERSRGPLTVTPGGHTHQDWVQIERQGEFQLNKTLRGALVDVNGVATWIDSPVVTEVVFAFSPTAEDHFREKVVDPMNQQIIYANSPAMIWDGNKFVVVMRMWLDKEVVEKQKLAENILSDNYFYATSYNSKMEELNDHGRVLGIPTRVGGIGDGPIEPRTFWHYDRIYLSFNTAVHQNKTFIDTTFFWDYENEKVAFPLISEGNPLLKNHDEYKVPRDKHWSPYMHNGQLYFIYSLDPLRIMACDRHSKCSFTHNESGNDYKFEQANDSLRGGTPTLHYKDDYYITIAHSTLFINKTKVDPQLDWKRFYTVNLVVLKVIESNHRVVYLSSPIEFNEKFMSQVPIVREKYIKHNFLFPVTLLIENQDNIIIGGHVNDHSSYLFRMSGLSELMRKIMTGSESLSETGPKPGALHSLTKQQASEQYGFSFHVHD